ncbi:hypothetical protein DFP72DRAFT_1065163 [Ephemerocybe angulata]|uniref:Uncharacterized protein n=1 Tax=Ephemerocybe angulata TaxID=980116 RepID=A0A8H6I2W2_9AGAR|nr:hypothetical protein DFP72DRAFT_1065163 [Tulosesus angulatus]
MGSIHILGTYGPLSNTGGLGQKSPKNRLNHTRKAQKLKGAVPGTPMNIVAQRLVDVQDLDYRVNEALREIEGRPLVLRKNVEEQYRTLVEAKAHLSVVLPQLVLLAREVEPLDITDEEAGPQPVSTMWGKIWSVSQGHRKTITLSDVRKRLDDIVDDEVLWLFEYLGYAQLVPPARPPVSPA